VGFEHPVHVPQMSEQEEHPAGQVWQALLPKLNFPAGQLVFATHWLDELTEYWLAIQAQV
jgi:hypothetical protein